MLRLQRDSPVMQEDVIDVRCRDENDPGTEEPYPHGKHGGMIWGAGGSDVPDRADPAFRVIDRESTTPQALLFLADLSSLLEGTQLEGER